MTFTLTPQLLAILGLGGVLFNFIGGLYLAYDLLGGPRGPLRTLTEVITYVVVSLIVSVGSYLVLFEIITLLNFRIEDVLGSTITFVGVLGLGFGGGLGTALGYSLTLQARSNSAAPRKPARYGARVLSACLIGAVTGLIGNGIYLSVAQAGDVLRSEPATFVLAFAYNVLNGLVLGTLVALLLVRRVFDLRPQAQPSFDWPSLYTGLLSGLIIGVMVGFGYWLFFGPDPAIGLGGVMAGILGGVGLGVVVGSAAQVEWWIDHLPLRRLGTFGIVLILFGLALESIQYFPALLNVPTH